MVLWFSGGIIQLEDLAGYSVRSDDPPLVTRLRDSLTLYGLEPPAGSILLHHALKILEGEPISLLLHT